MIDVGALLHEVESAPPIDAVQAVAVGLGEMVGAHEVNLLIADFSGRALVRLTSAGSVSGARSHGVEQAETLPLEGTPYEGVLRTQQPLVDEVGHGARVIVPVTDRGDAIGLLEMTVPRPPKPDELTDICSAAHALAYVLIAARRHTDVFEWGQRSTPFALAAEIQRRLLPASYTCEAGQFTLAGWLEPASSVGGDTFDYTLDRDTLQVSITDAVGHQVEAPCWPPCSSAASATGGARASTSPSRPGYANDALAENAAAGQFVTGQLMRVDLHTGRRVDHQRRARAPAAAARRAGRGGDAAGSRRRSASCPGKQLRRAGRSRWSRATGSSS